MACDAEDCGFQMLNDDEFVTSVQEESDPVDDETNEDDDNNSNNKSSNSPSNAETFSALETAMEWYKQQSEFCLTQLLLLKRIRDLAAKKQRCAMVAPELQRRMRTNIFGSYCQKKQTEHSIRPVSSALFSYRYDSSKADRVRRLGHIGLYALGLSDVFHLPPLTVACD
ncbi:uncharacterized protein TNCV_2605731 [Trichonephila clavipes]|nr:uncharacterized protein TNCV_2605731 [Trichonephila clavipes]